MDKFLAVFVGGGIGSLGRYSLGLLVQRLGFAGIFPWATLLANTLACLVFALVMVFFKDKMGSTLAILLTTGFCGGLSTFSTFSVETVDLVNKQLYGLAAFNIFVSLVLCLGCIMLVARV